MLRKYAKKFRMSSKVSSPTNLMSSPKSETKEKIQNLRTKSDRLLDVLGSHRNYKDSIKFHESCEGSRKGILSIKIGDTGCGMTDNEIKKIYEPFTQANKEIQSKFGGTGLGLWLCHKLIHIMEGKIRCKSVLGKGTEFTISLKVRYKHDVKAPSGHSKSLFKSLTVISLSETEEEVRNSLKDVGCKVISCKNTNQKTTMKEVLKEDEDMYEQLGSEECFNLLS